MAKVASAFFEPPWMEAIMELQQKMEKLYNPSWLRQLDYIESMQRQLCASMATFETLQPSVLRSASGVAQVWHSSLSDTFKNMAAQSAAMESILASIAPVSKLQAELQSALSALDWPGINKVMQNSSLVLQKEYAIAHVCTLTEDISCVMGESEDEAIDFPSELSAEDEQIIADEVSSILSSEKNWEQRLMDSVAKLKKTHPVLASILYHIIVTILLGIMVNLIAMAIGQAVTPAKVYEKPRTTSPVIYHLEPLQQVKIIGEEPYYFQIELTDNNTQETMVGFVSKRSIKEIDVQEDPT